MNLHITHFSHVGNHRKNQEDAVFVSTRHNLFVVADGMGGHLGGEVASRICVETFEHEYGIANMNHPGRPADAMCVVVDRANRFIHEAATDLNLPGMGTTVVAAVVEDGPTPNTGTLHVVHVGDSRAYMLRDGLLFQLTQDHALVDGRLYGAVGVEPTTDKTTYSAPVQAGSDGHPGDVLLLCSDGLYGELSPGDIAYALSQPDAADKLLEGALARGGHDNISAIVVRIL